MVRPERFELPTFWFVARRSDPAELRAQFLNITTALQHGTHVGRREILRNQNLVMISGRDEQSLTHLILATISARSPGGVIQTGAGLRTLCFAAPKK